MNAASNPTLASTLATTPATKLLLAAELIADALTAIEVPARTCKCCRRVEIKNWSAKQATEALEPMLGKLRRIALNNTVFLPGTVATRQHDEAKGAGPTADQAPDQVSGPPYAYP